MTMKLTMTRGFGKMNLDETFQMKLAIAIISEKRLTMSAQSDVVIEQSGLQDFEAERSKTQATESRPLAPDEETYQDANWEIAYPRAA
jgi:hypothetical protein